MDAGEWHVDRRIGQVENRDRWGMVGHETADGRREQVRAHVSPAVQVGNTRTTGATKRDDGQMPPAADELDFDLHWPCPATGRVHRSLR